MPKAIKLKDDLYVDSSSIINKYTNGTRITLKDFLTSRKILDSKIMVRNNNTNASYASGSYIGWNEEVFNNSNGLIVNSGGGLVTINYTGYIKISFGVWLNGATNARPWLTLTNYGKDSLFDAIDDNSSGYVTLGGSNIIAPVTSGDRIGIAINSTGNVNINAGTGRGKATYMTIEII